MDSFQIPCILVDKYLSEANDGQVKVYLCLQRLSQDNSRQISVRAVADMLNREDRYVRSALKYWDEKGFITVSNDISGNLSHVEFNSNIIPDEKIHQTSEGINLDTSGKTTGSIGIIPVKTRFISAEEIGKLKTQDSDFAELLSYLESKVYAAPVSPDHIRMITSLYLDYKMSLDNISILVTYCIERNKYAPAYILKVAGYWIEKGRVDLPNADHPFSTVLKVKKTLGLSTVLSQENRDIVLGWRKADDDVIVRACKKAVSQTQRVSIKYVNAIMQDWLGKNIYTEKDLDNSLSSKKGVKNNE